MLSIHSVGVSVSVGISVSGSIGVGVRMINGCHSD